MGRAMQRKKPKAADQNVDIPGAKHVKDINDELAEMEKEIGVF